ncbi:4-oxalocrotonate decarboxylase [Caballeronia terrestris]|uniref:4-oxalocrotonate decarboxylase n=1 Tax=Caballeronia terrestris TaxID=1226301 RepID=A0A158J3C0_9BURK|nr:hypothetical protein [Caballeronia terrestris]SAL63357.1 4-oxalocrotonate decarboxylase [Caballeronia terrestris]
MNSKALIEAWRAGRQLDQPPTRLTTLEEGYDAQDAFIALTGEKRVGWKLGVGSPAAMRAADAHRPLIGQLLASRCYALSETVILPQLRPVTIEFEIVFVLGVDVAPDAQIVDPMSIVSATHVGFEFVLSRFKDRRAVGQPAFASDNVGFEAFVLGPQIDPHSIADIVASVVVKADGAPPAHGLYGDEASDPVAALAHLLAHARERGVTLRRGDWVSTGAAAKPIDAASAEFDVSAHYVAQTFSVHVASKESQ